jgi:hypothetical protein
MVMWDCCSSKSIRVVWVTGSKKLCTLIIVLNSIPFSFSFCAYIEFNMCKLTLLFINNVCYFTLGIVEANNVIVKWRWLWLWPWHSPSSWRPWPWPWRSWCGVMEDSVSLTSTIALSPLDYLANGWSNTFRQRGNIIIKINLLYIDLFSLHMENL